MATYKANLISLSAGKVYESFTGGSIVSLRRMIIILWGKHLKRGGIAEITSGKDLWVMEFEQDREIFTQTTKQGRTYTINAVRADGSLGPVIEERRR